MVVTNQLGAASSAGSDGSMARVNTTGVIPSLPYCVQSPPNWLIQKLFSNLNGLLPINPRKMALTSPRHCLMALLFYCSPILPGKYSRKLQGYGLKSIYCFFKIFI